MSHRQLLVRRLLLAGVLAATSPASMAAQDSLAVAVRMLIADAGVPRARQLESSKHLDEVGRLYRSRADAPLWLDGRRVTGAGRQAIAELARADAHGLDPREYGAWTLDGVARRIGLGARLPAAELARFDLQLTLGVIGYLDHLHSGRLPHPAFGSSGGSAGRVDWADVVSRGVEGDSIPELLAAAAPRLTQYRNLQRLLQRYRELAADSTLGPLPVGAPVRPGDAYGGLSDLRRYLVALGDLPSRADDSGPAGRYEGAVVDAVRRFQLRHGLTADGIVGPETMAELNTPLARRVRQIELALERLRWLRPIGRRSFVVVNIPAFHLFAFDSVGGTGGPSLRMKVVVGKALDTRTPMLLGEMRYVEFRPYWNVPRSIVTAEIVPLLRRNRDYLRLHDMELVAEHDRVIGDTVSADALRRLMQGELRVRQRPGPSNALGLAKFVFPNAAGIYLHGTPQQALFARARRDFSHGCIRVEDPVALAEWVLRDQPAWGRERVEAAMAGARTVRAPLARPLPVAIFYTTAVAFPDGSVSFYRDVYGLDRGLSEALDRIPTPP